MDVSARPDRPDRPARSSPLSAQSDNQGMGSRYRGKGARFAAAIAALLTAPMIIGGVAAASTPAPPWKDANNGAPSDHGWFQVDWPGTGTSATGRGSRGQRLLRVQLAHGRPVHARADQHGPADLVHPRRSGHTAGPPGLPGYNVNTDTSIPAEIRASADIGLGQVQQQRCAGQAGTVGTARPAGALAVTGLLGAQRDPDREHLVRVCRGQGQQHLGRPARVRPVLSHRRLGHDAGRTIP